MATKHRTYKTLAAAKTWDGAILAGGESIRLINPDGILQYVLDPIKGGIQDDIYSFPPNTNAGLKRWILVAPQAPMSHVSAYCDNTSQSMITGIENTVIFNQKNYDLLSEYNTSTGVFTAAYDGKYGVKAHLRLASTAWITAKYALAKIEVNSTVIIVGHRFATWASATHPAHVFVGGTVNLSASDTIQILLEHNHSSNINLGESIPASIVSIDRMI